VPGCWLYSSPFLKLSSSGTESQVQMTMDLLSTAIITPLKNPTRRVGGTKPEALVPPALRVGFLRGVWKEMTKKSDIREVKTVKTTKSDMERKNPSKSTTIWNQTVSAITQAKSDLLQKFQNSASSLGPWLSFTFWHLLISSKFGVVATVWKWLP